MSKPKLDLLPGTLDLLILKTLALEPTHSYRELEAALRDHRT
jgi:hypothetical protein